MSKVNRSVANMISGGVGYLVPMVLNLVFTPIIVSKLGKEAYGLQSLVNVIIGYLMVADMGLDIPVTKFIAEFRAKEDKQSLNKMLNNTLQIYLIIGVFGMILISLLSGFLVKDVFSIPPEMQGEARTVFYLAGVGFVGGLMSMWGKAIFNGLQRYDIGNGINIVFNFLSTCLGILVVVLGYGLTGFILMRVLFSLLASVTYFYYSKKLLPDFKFTLGIDLLTWALLKGQIGYGFILRASGMFFARIDQALIASWIGVSAVGVYAIPFLVTTSLSSLLASITHFVFPMATELYSTNRQEEFKSMFIKVLGFVNSIASLLFVPLIIFGDKFLILWVGKSIGEQGALVLLFLSIAAYFSAMLVIIVNSIMVGIGQLRIFTFFILIRNSIIGLGCVLLIKQLSIAGAGISMMIACIPDLFYFFYSLKKHLHISIVKVFNESYKKPLLLSSVLGIGCFFLRPYADTWIGLIVCCGTFILAYLSLGFPMAVFGETEKRVLSMLWLRVGSKKNK